MPRAAASPSPTLAEYLDTWLAVMRTQLQPSTWHSYRYQIRRYVLPQLGEVPLGALAPSQLTAHYAFLLERGRRDGGALGVRTVRYVHDILRTALAEAVRQEALDRNPADRARPPRTDPGRPHAGDGLQVWDEPTLRAFLKATARHRFGLAWLLAAATGMRRSEVCGLRWADVDLDAATLHVRRALVVAGGQMVLKTPKTGRSRRLGIDARTVDALAARRAAQAQQQATAGAAWCNDWDLVVTGGDGSPVYPSRLSADFHRIVRRLGLPPIPLHGLRHTHASLLLQHGVPITVVSDRLGHAKTSMTLNVYGHVLPARDDIAVQRFAAAVYGDDGPAPGAGAP